ncbi:IclR family transcriptional regulator [Thalassococcus sp. S3]|uniref:IclR family transcriptional regulator n=1 Tax=Thalassococcus sp. S3 TaxID=2017482 RepID=UPI0010247FA2|nr:IclR family transcriptional regulator [Thalassococcus sp. S3]QBF31935.1 IclR family transcriptional regulator [Thalassococcus sp. S3]
MPDSDIEDKDRNFVTALARGLDVLRCFERGEAELTNTDFSERTGLPKATISRLTHTLCKLDYLVADPRKGTYRLSSGVLQLGFGVLSSMEITERAADPMRALCTGPNPYVTVALGERHRMDVVYVAVHRSHEDVSLTMHVGSRIPLFHSAIGRAVLIGMPEDERAAAFAEANEIDPEGDAERRSGFHRGLSEYEAQGYCTGYGEWRPDVNGIAAPVFSMNGSRVYGLNVGGPSFHVKRKQLEGVYAKRLIEAAETLSIRA